MGRQIEDRRSVPHEYGTAHPPSRLRIAIGVRLPLETGSYSHYCEAILLVPGIMDWRNMA
jgi:hypothetical protein